MASHPNHNLLPIRLHRWRPSVSSKKDSVKPVVTCPKYKREMSIKDVCQKKDCYFYYGWTFSHVCCGFGAGEEE